LIFQFLSAALTSGSTITSAKALNASDFFMAD
jgi:hypothetical protein